MPLYEYECDACHRRFEQIQKFSDPPVTQCAECGGGPVRRLLSSPAIQFKGAGWYVTDYAKSGKASTKDAGAGTESAPAKTDSKPAGDTSAPTPKAD